MKIMLATTPIRPIPTDFAPLGSLSIISYLARNGIEDVEFYNIDGNRPSYEEAIDHITQSKPDVLGISAVVSTAYEYTKRMSLDVKKALPETLIIVGGNMAASAEVLLKRTGTDICVTGEGERVFLDVLRRAATTHDPADFADIGGLMLIDRNGKLVNTGFTPALDKTEIYNIDWRNLEESSDIDMFIPKIQEDGHIVSRFTDDSRAHEPHRADKRYIRLPGAKGCVARCTFCHRWDKGIRYIPVDIFMARLKKMIAKYNIGFISVADENFGTDRRWLKDFCEQIKPLDILWRVSGMRVNCVTPEQISMMKDAGCVGITFGMETGSERMLQIMEKKVKLKDNYNAVRWIIEAGLTTVVQLVIGMPGETPATIAETIEFCKWAATLSDEQNPNDLSINFAQALPGTPLYEFARHKGLIDSSLDGEEAYLMRISDKDAHDEVTTINFTDHPFLTCQTWRSWITIETNYAYVKKFGITHYREKLLSDANHFTVARKDTGYYANPKRLVDTSVATDSLHDECETIELQDALTPPLMRLIREKKFGLALICYPVLSYRLRRFLIFLVIMKSFQRNGAKYTWGMIGEYLSHHLGRLLKKPRMVESYVSLRKIVNKDLGMLRDDSPEMAPLRKGR